MSWLRLSQVAGMTRGLLQGEDVAIEGVSIDSRSAASGDLFIALKGERHDAHGFIDETLQAAAVMVERDVEGGLPRVRVKDTRSALGKFAGAWREGLAMPVVGLTGSNGKTTVKEMIAAILGRRGSVHATRGNLNNDIGMPLTLLALRETHDYAVIEMGANHFGEIAYLSQIARPDVALITNAGPAHLEGFGDVDGVARAKGEIFGALDETGIAVINADDIYAEYWRSLNRGRRVLSFGFSAWADVRGEWQSGEALVVHTEADVFEIALPLAGRHNALNALAATAVALVLESAPEDIKQGLETMQAVAGRLQAKPGLAGVRVIDDSYNANPASLAAAIEVLAAAGAPRALVLGDMGELGRDAARIHRAMGAHAKEAGIERLYALGDLSRAAVEAFGTGGQHFDDIEDLIRDLRANLEVSLTVLVKGSRSMGMERVVAALQAGDTQRSTEGNGHAA